MRMFVTLDKLNYWLFGFSILANSYFQLADGTVEDDEFACGQPLRNPTRQFPPKSRANGVAATLRYGNKPYWPMQWYMNEEVFSVGNQVYSPSMKIVEFHNRNSKGENVAVVIIGNSAVNCEHKEISQRCLPNSSSYSYHSKKSIFAFLSKTEDCSSKSLATAVAGIIGMTHEDQNCGVGIAPMCTIGNIIVEPSTTSGSPEHGAYKILSSVSNPGSYVFVHAWSLSSHDYKSRILHALEDINMLNFNSKRQMRPHVMGSGDLGQFASSCQCNEYTSADSMFVFGSVSHDGLLTSYSETCASLIGVTYSTSDGNEFYNNIITITDSTNDAPTYAPKRTTAVSAAIGGGVIALISDVFFEEFNRSPSISDIAFLLAFSCTSESLKNKNIMWFTNGVGREYSPQAGFGLPRMDEVLTLLKNWVPLEPPTIYEFSRLSRSLTYVSNMVCFFEISNPQANRYIQLITVELSAKLIKRGALTVYLISPAGTVSCILEGRPYDVHKKKYKKILLRTNHFIGETPLGQWSIRFYTYKEDSIPSYRELQRYSFPTPMQRTTAPPKSQFHNADHHQPIIPVGTSNLGPQPVNPSSAPQASSNSQFAGQPNLGPQSANSNSAPPASTNSPFAGQLNLGPPAVNSNSAPPASTNSQFAGQLVTGGGSSPVIIYPSSLPNPTGAPANPVRHVSFENSPTKTHDSDPKLSHQSFPQNAFKPADENKPPSGQGTATHPNDSANLPIPPAPVVQPWANQPLVQPHNEFRFTTTTSPIKPYADLNHEQPNVIDQVKFRFLLVENVPSILKLQPLEKNKKQTKLDFELIKAWVDFKNFLLVQTDPKNFGTSTVGLWEVYDFTNRFTQKLLTIQKKLKINSAIVSPSERLQKMFGSDLFPNVQISETSNASNNDFENRERDPLKSS